MDEGPTLIVVPCYNEERRLPVPSFLDFARADRGFRFLFVDDGSRDRTASVLQQLCAKRPEIFRFLQLPDNRGKAEAVRQGVLHGLHDAWRFIGYWDADLATPLDALGRFRDVMLTNPDVQIVMGARVKLLGRHIERRALRHYLGRVFATIAALVLDIHVYDTQCGAKLFRVSNVLRAMFAEPFVSRWIFDVELLARFLSRHDGFRLGLTATDCMYEVPLDTWEDVGASRVRGRDFLVAPLELMRIYRSYPPRSRRAEQSLVSR
jgi:glycosyltransferase involved in cell wall biosynthesis